MPLAWAELPAVVVGQLASAAPSVDPWGSYLEELAGPITIKKKALISDDL